MDPITALNRALDQTGGIVRGVQPDQLGQDTSCTDFDVRALMNHLIGAISSLSTGIATGKPDLSLFSQDFVSDDATGAYERAAAEARAAVTPEVLGQTVAMPFGDVPGAVAVSVATLEALQHGWDLAKATGQSPDMDAELSETGMEMAKQFPPELVRNPGVWGPETDAADDASPHDRLAAFLGRVV